ncbi:MAG TPA: hypothetical protein VMN58_03865 [Acidimicrobiales bacterium]|nr:hypothetical protein [Acidimicrobiales bacterium]
MAAAKKRTVTDEHKAAMAEGRTQSRKVAAYLEGLESNKPKRGRKRTAESIDKRLAAIDEDMTSASPIKALSLIQERRDLIDEKSRMGETVDLTGLEEDFIEAAAAYGMRKGISYAAWRELGVPAAVLKSAGISRAAG